MPKFAAQVDLMGLPLKNVRVEQAATAPTSPEEGRIYHDTALKSVRVFLNGTWVPLDPSNTTLGQLKDLLITNAASGQVLVFNGTNWVNVGLGISHVSGLQSALDGKAAATHTHTAAQTTSGTFDIARLPVASSGTSNTTQVVRADDARLSNARLTTGSAGGDLEGNYPNPTIKQGAIDTSKVAVSNRDGLSTVPSMRTLGSGSQQAMRGSTALNEIANPTGTMDMAGQRVQNVAAPLLDGDAANKGYVDQAVNGLTVKSPVVVASTANINLGSTTQLTIDGVQVTTDDRVLVKNQSTASQNGIYVWVQGSGWSRTPDANSWESLKSAYVLVMRGTTQQDTGWVQTADTSGAIGSVPLTFTQFAGAGTVEAGNGLTRSGNTLTVGAGTGITVSATAVGIANNWAGQTAITTVGTITNGTWRGTTVEVARGGTGATTAADARTNLVAATSAQKAVPALTPGTWVTLFSSAEVVSTNGYSLSFYEAANGEDIILDSRVSSGAIQVRSDVAFANLAIIARYVGMA